MVQEPRYGILQLKMDRATGSVHNGMEQQQSKTLWNGAAKNEWHDRARTLTEWIGAAKNEQSNYTMVLSSNTTWTEWNAANKIGQSNRARAQWNGAAKNEQNNRASAQWNGAAREH